MRLKRATLAVPHLVLNSCDVSYRRVVTVRVEPPVASLTNEDMIFIKPTFAYRADVVHEPLCYFYFKLFLFEEFLRRLVTVLVAEDNEAGIHKQTVCLLCAKVVEALVAVLHEAPEAAALLSADGAFNLVTAADPFAKVTELILVIEKDLGSP